MSAPGRGAGGARDTTVALDADASPADIAVVTAGLRAFNVARIGEPEEEPVQFLVRDADGTVVGGLLGHIRWRWLYVAKLWVAEDHRGEGLGSKLMRGAEAHGRSRGCLGIHLDTFEYQARPFYEKLGYELIGTLEGYPPGYRQFFLARKLADG